MSEIGDYDDAVDDVKLSDEQMAELEAAAAEIERGEWVDGEELLQQIRSRLRR